MPETLPQYLYQHAQSTPDKIALRERIYGIWKSLTWREYLEEVRYFSLGLVSLGLSPEETIAIIGDNRPEWVIAELAAQAAGAKAIGIYQDAVVNEMVYIITHAYVSFIVVEDQEQVDKILEMWDQLQGVRRLIYYDPKGLRNYSEDFLIHFDEAIELGRLFESQNPGLFEANLEKGKSSDLAILSTTSGTTGNPKLAELTHANLLNMGKNLMQVDPLEADDEFVSFLPLAWIGEQMMALACGLQIGFTVNFPEEPETVQHDLREIGPKVMFSPPRIWENLVSQVQVKIQDSTRLKRVLYHWAMPLGYEMADTRFRKQQPSAGLRFKYMLADLMVSRRSRTILAFAI